LFGP